MFDKVLRAAAVLALVTGAGTAAAQDKLSGGDKKWMEREVGPIITKQEIAMFQQIDKDDRKLFKELFWIRRDFNPGTPENEFKNSYEQRRKVADENFGDRRRKGSETDMGKIFLLLGTPDQRAQGRSAIAGGFPDPGSVGGSGGGGGPGGGNEDPSATGFDEPQQSGGGAGNRQLMTWVYNPKPQLGLPNGLEVEFRNQQQFGMRITNQGDIEEPLERVKERTVANPGVNYARDEKGRLKKPDDKYDPNSPAKLALAALRETGETSDAIDFDLNHVFFRSSEGQIYIPIDFVVNGGLSKDEITVFGSVENADGFEIYQFEQFAKAAKDDQGRHAYEMPLQLSPGLYTLYVGVLDGKGGTPPGTKIVDLEVPDYDTGDLTLSSVLMFSGAEQTGDALSRPGMAYLLGGYHFTPKRDNKYTNTEQLAGVLNAYNFGVAGEKPDLTIQVRFFKGTEARGQTQESAFMLQTAEMALTIFDIPLDIPNFSEPGDYRVEVHVKDKVKNETLKHEIEFVVEP